MNVVCTENQSECLLIYLHDHIQQIIKPDVKQTSESNSNKEALNTVHKKQANLEYNSTSTFSTNVINFLKFEVKQGLHFIYRVLVPGVISQAECLKHFNLFC